MLLPKTCRCGFTLMESGRASDFIENPAVLVVMAVECSPFPLDSFRRKRYLARLLAYVYRERE